MVISEELRRVIISIGLRLLAAVVTLIIGRWLAGWSRRWMNRSLQESALTPSLITLLVTLTHYGILLLATMTALAFLGVPPTAIVGVAAIVVVILAVALQQSLGNLAATIIFLLFKPFEVGDVVETSGVFGIVNEIQMFSSVLLAADNKTHILPNAKIQGAGLANYSKAGSIRVDMSFRVSYESDAERAKRVMLDLLADDSRVLAEPAPQVFVRELAQTHMDLAALPFVDIADFLSFQREFPERVKIGFEQAGVAIPYTQQKVHLVSTTQN